MKHSLFPKLSFFLMAVLFITASCTKTVEKNENSTGTGGTTQNYPGKFNVTVSTIARKLRDHGNAEDGNGANARLWNPTKMVYDNRNNILYVANGTTIRSIDQQNNVNTYMTLGTISNFNEILDIDLAPGSVGGTLYFTTKENDLIKIEPDGTSFKTTKREGIWRQ